MTTIPPTAKKRYKDVSRSTPINKNCARIQYLCEYCGKVAWETRSSFDKKKRHFCSMQCYANYRTHIMPPEEQNNYGTGLPFDERAKRKKARSELNHAIRDGKIERQMHCDIDGCTNQPEAHHDDYDNPLNVRWLCFQHHREYHKRIYENPERVEAQ